MERGLKELRSFAFLREIDVSDVIASILIGLQRHVVLYLLQHVLRRIVVVDDGRVIQFATQRVAVGEGMGGSVEG